MKKTNPYGKSIGKSPKTAEIGRKIAKSGWTSTIFVEILTKHQARAYSDRETLNRAQREAFRGKSQVGVREPRPEFGQEMSYGRSLERWLKLFGLPLRYTEWATLAQDRAKWARLITRKRPH